MLTRSSAQPSSHRVRLLRVQEGFTLIEVLVSLLILSVLAATAWKGMDSISAARQVTDENLKQTLRLQAVMMQMEMDLSQVVDAQIVDGMQFDGAHLRLVRRGPEGGLVVVTWYTANNRLYRWTSAKLEKVGEVQKAWLGSFLLQGREPNTLVALKGVERWQVFCFRGGAMSNCQSTGNLVQASQAPATPSKGSTGVPQQNTPVNKFLLPDAVRCQMTLGEGSGFAGNLTRDLPLAPHSPQ